MGMALARIHVSLGDVAGIISKLGYLCRHIGDLALCMGMRRQGCERAVPFVHQHLGDSINNTLVAVRMLFTVGIIPIGTFRCRYMKYSIFFMGYKISDSLHNLSK